METTAGTGGPETTGRFIVILKEEAAGEAAAVRSTLGKVAGLKDLASSLDFKDSAVAANDRAVQDNVHFEKLGIMVITSEEAVQALSASTSNAESPILTIEPEYFAYHQASERGGEFPSEYLRGYKDAVDHLYQQLSRSETAPGELAELSAVFADTPRFTWGLQATRVSSSRFNGQGVKVTILDTGIDEQHPDFRGRFIQKQSFSGFPVQDVDGHGTHCVGTACGPHQPATGVRRYGVASSAEIYVGKVFNNDPRPRAATGNVIAGLEWAVANGCKVVSLSLGIPFNGIVAQLSLIHI